MGRGLIWLPEMTLLEGMELPGESYHVLHEPAPLTDAART